MNQLPSYPFGFLVEVQGPCRQHVHALYMIVLAISCLDSTYMSIHMVVSSLHVVLFQCMAWNQLIFYNTYHVYDMCTVSWSIWSPKYFSQHIGVMLGYIEV